MALTLPYPSMNFVPLDVLTAAEQNQLVANIEYIANQFPITSQNIDWTTSITSLQLTDMPAHTVGTNDYTLFRFGNMMALNIATIWFEGSIPATTWYKIGTVPQNTKPQVPVRGIVLVGNDVGTIVDTTLVKVETNGNVYVWTRGGYTNIYHVIEGVNIVWNI